jgi:hypothetical protein
MPSLTSVPATCPAAVTPTVRRAPAVRTAPHSATAISGSQATVPPRLPPVTKADIARQPTGSCSRLATLVDANATSDVRAAALMSRQVPWTATKPPR